jgi:hypothetical protein
MFTRGISARSPYSALLSVPWRPLTRGRACPGPASEDGEIGWFPAPSVTALAAAVIKAGWVVFNVGDLEPSTDAVSACGDPLVGEECTPFGKRGESLSTIELSVPRSLESPR